MLQDDEKLTIIQDLFRSRLKSIIKCDVCGNISESSETFLYFSLSIPKEYRYVRIIYYESNIIPPTYFILKTLANNIESIIYEFCAEYNIDRNKLLYPSVANRYIYDSFNIDTLPQDLDNFELYLFNRFDNDNIINIDNSINNNNDNNEKIIFDGLELDDISNNNGSESPNTLFPIQADDLNLNESAFQPVQSIINNSNSNNINSLFSYNNYTFLNFYSVVNEKCVYLYPSYIQYSEVCFFIFIFL